MEPRSTGRHLRGGRHRRVHRRLRRPDVLPADPSSPARPRLGPSPGDRDGRGRPRRSPEGALPDRRAGPPGSAFFEAVDAWTKDLQAVRALAFDGLPGAEAFDGLVAEGLGPRPSRRRYRYITELYLAALLYAVSTVGEADWSRTRDRLFRWAYGIRLDYERVGDPTIQRHAIAEDAPFPALRDAVSHRALAVIERTGRVRGRTHDTELRILLEEVSS